MQAVDAGRPLRGRMPQQHSAVVLQIRRQFDLQRVLDFRRLQERPQQRGGREVGDAERFADKIGAALPHVLDTIERRSDGGSISFQIALADFMAEPVEPRKNRKHPPQAGIGLAAHARCQRAQRNVRVVPEQRRDESRAQRRPERLVEIVLQRERALPRRAVTRIKRRLGVMLLERGDDARRIRDGSPVEPQNRQLALAGRAPDLDQVVGAEHTAPVRDALVVERPARLFAVVRDRDVPQRRGVHRRLTFTRDQPASFRDRRNRAERVCRLLLIGPGCLQAGEQLNIAGRAAWICCYLNATRRVGLPELRPEPCELVASGLLILHALRRCLHRSRRPTRRSDIKPWHLAFGGSRQFSSRQSRRDEQKSKPEHGPSSVFEDRTCCHRLAAESSSNKWSRQNLSIHQGTGRKELDLGPTRPGRPASFYQPTCRRFPHWTTVQSKSGALCELLYSYSVPYQRSGKWKGVRNGKFKRRD